MDLEWFHSHLDHVIDPGNGCLCVANFRLLVLFIAGSRTPAFLLSRDRWLHRIQITFTPTDGGMCFLSANYTGDWKVQCSLSCRNDNTLDDTLTANTMLPMNKRIKPQILSTRLHSLLLTFCMHQARVDGCRLILTTGLWNKGARQTPSINSIICHVPTSSHYSMKFLVLPLFQPQWLYSPPTPTQVSSWVYKLDIII